MLNVQINFYDGDIPQGLTHETLSILSHLVEEAREGRGDEGPRLTCSEHHSFV